MTIEINSELNSTDASDNEVFNVSVVVPVRNEAESIGLLIRGLERQTFRPAEVIITDGGSEDRTREIIKRIQTESPLKIILIETEHAFPGKGRNLAFKRAGNNWFACIDAGTVPQNNWLERLVTAAREKREARVVFGSYRPKIDSLFTKCAALTYAGKQTRDVESTASCLIHRSAWEATGDFREDLRSGEDLLFFQKIAEKGVAKTFANDAVVEWQIQPTFGKTYSRFRTYSKNGMKAGLFKDWQFRVLSFYAIIIFFVILGLFFKFLLLLPILIVIARTERRILHWYQHESFGQKLRQMFDPFQFLMVFAINLTIDMAMIHGVISWLWNDRILQRSD